MGAATLAATDETFATDVLQASGPVLVDFWAEWCAPCRAMAPALEELAGEYGDNLRIVKVNVDENPEVPNTYSVRGLPTFILFKNGEPAASLPGALPKTRLKAWIDQAIG
jgi:thioredoxin 1